MAEIGSGSLCLLRIEAVSQHAGEPTHGIGRIERKHPGEHLVK